MYCKGKWCTAGGKDPLFGRVDGFQIDPKRTTDTSQMAAEIKTLFIRNHIYLHTDSEKDVQVLRERFLEWKYRNAYKLNGKY